MTACCGYFMDGEISRNKQRPKDLRRLRLRTKKPPASSLFIHTIAVDAGETRSRRINAGGTPMESVPPFLVFLEFITFFVHYPAISCNCGYGVLQYNIL